MLVLCADLKLSRLCSKTYLHNPMMIDGSEKTKIQTRFETEDRDAAIFAVRDLF